MIQPQVTQGLAENAQAPVIISLEGPQTQGLPTVAQMQENAAERQAGVLADLTAADFTLTIQYQIAAALAGEVTSSGLDKLACHADVVAVSFDAPVFPLLAESVPLIHADELQLLGVDGTDVDIAVLDTGIDFDHPDLTDSLIGEKCTMIAAWCPDDPLYPLECQNPDHPANDCDGHGSHVSGIITSNGVIAPMGVAPNADIFAYKVLPDERISPFGNFGWVMLALEDVIMANTLPEREDIELVNMSLGDGGSHSDPNQCETLIPEMTNLITWLRFANGTLSVASSGNSGSKTGISYPACIPNVVSVGAVYDAVDVDPPSCDTTTAPDQVACRSQSADFLDLLAPGSEIISSFPDHFVDNPCTFPPEPLETPGMGPCSGTSMASPHAVGVAALLLDALPGLTPDEVVNRLKSTGALVTDDFDPNNVRTTPRIDARVALLTNDAGDFDQDGCTNGQEFGATPALGGERNPLHFWDFYDVWAGDPPARDKIVNIIDIGAVVLRFGTGGDPTGDPLTPPLDTTSYHTAFDRGGPYVGVNLWHLRPPDGAINIIDIGAVIIQFGHTCSET